MGVEGALPPITRAVRPEHEPASQANNEGYYVVVPRIARVIRARA